jgi:hypothetical protein
MMPFSSSVAAPLKDISTIINPPENQNGFFASSNRLYENYSFLRYVKIFSINNLFLKAL